jgi:hypothetical protein
MKQKIIVYITASVILIGMTACAAPQNQAVTPAPKVSEAAAAETTEASQAEALDTLEPSPSAAPDFEAEQKVFELFTATDRTGSDASEIIAALPEINWAEYERYTEGKTMDLISWLYVLTIDDEAQVLSLMLSTEGLDGAYSEGFAGVLGRIYMADPYLFIQCLSQLEQAQAEAVCRYVAFDCGYGVREDAQDAIADTRAFLKDDSLPAAERAAAGLLIDTLDSGAA